MQIRRVHREELEHAHAERKDVRGHRWRRVLVLAKLRGMPTDGGRAREHGHGRFTDDVGEDLGEAEIGERDDSLVRRREREKVRGGGRK